MNGVLGDGHPRQRRGTPARPGRGARTGYKGHIAAEPDTRLITAAKLTKAAGAGSGDAEVGGELIAADDSLDGPADVLGDSAYGSGQLLSDLAAAGHEAVIKPKPVSTPPGLLEAFTADDFTVDHDTQTVTCPNGARASFANKARKAKFGSTCSACPFRSRCTTSPRGRTVGNGIHDRCARADRARWARDEQLRRDYRQHRPMIERSIAWMTRGTRTLRYRGVTKNDAWWNLRAAAVNLQRLTTLGLTSDHQVWVLG